MRPVNLIPPEDRRGEQAPLRTGALVYLVVGAFVAVLIGVTSLVLVGNTIEEREVDLTQLQREDAEASAEAQRLAPYVQFQRFSEQRVLTVTSLADSRFDWERVMRELSLVLPSNVWLVSLNATASPSVTAGESSSGGSGGSSDASGLRAAAPGPALEISGCASGQEAVDIDGVTRVGVQSSQLADESATGASTGDSAGSGDDCRTRAFIAKFEIVVAFDAAPVPITSDAAAVTATAPVTSTETTTSTGG
jgi:Tfp pilus assembly protein PilN